LFEIIELGSTVQVDVEDVMSNFMQVSAASATKMLLTFHKGGLLQATSRKHSFKVIKKEVRLGSTIYLIL
jgi:photosystem II stability/assembly factor-like uncharacterized protein